MQEELNKSVESPEILVFKTSLQTPVEVRFISQMLNDIPGIREWIVDLDDWEKILRIETDSVMPNDIITVLRKAGIHCKVLAMHKLSCKEP